MSPDRINQAWKRGYEAALSGGNPKCPYDTPALFGAWISGLNAGVNDKLASVPSERRAA